MGCPLATYIKEWRRKGSAKRRRRAQGGAILLQVGFAPLSYSNWEKGKEEVERRKEKGGRAPFPFPIRIGARGAARHLLLPLLFHYFGPMRPNNPRGVPITPGTPVYIP